MRYFVAALIGAALAVGIFVGCNQDGALQTEPPRPAMTAADAEPGAVKEARRPAPAHLCPPCPPIKNYPNNGGDVQLYWGPTSNPTALSRRINVNITVSDAVTGYCEGKPSYCPRNCKLTVTIRITNNNTTTPFTYQWEDTAHTVQPGYSSTETWNVDAACGTDDLDMPLENSAGRQLWIKKPDGSKFKWGCPDCPEAVEVIPISPFGMTGRR